MTTPPPPQFPTPPAPARPNGRGLLVVAAALLALAVAAGVVVAAGVLAPGRQLDARAPMGTEVTVLLPDDDVRTLYTTHETWGEFTCDVRDARGADVDLRPDMTAQPLRGTTTWYPRGGILAAGEVTVRCDSDDGGEFAVGPTFAFEEVAVNVLVGSFGALLAVAGAVCLIVGLSKRSRARSG